MIPCTTSCDYTAHFNLVLFKVSYSAISNTVLNQLIYVVLMLILCVIEINDAIKQTLLSKIIFCELPREKPCLV